MILNNKKTFSVLSVLAVSALLVGGVFTASAEDQGRDRGQSQSAQTARGEQPNFSNGREQTIEDGMEPVITQPAHADVSPSLVQPGKGALYTASSADLSDMIYRLGAPIMSGTIKIYEVWYGTWGTSTSPTPSAKNYQFFTNKFLADLSSDNRWALDQSYYQATASAPTAKTNVGPINSSIQSVRVATNVTKYKSTLSQSSIYNIAKDAYFPATNAVADPNGIYFVFTSSDIKVSGFGTQFCGWHSYNSSSRAKYSFVGDPANLSGCLPQTVGPNLAGADAMLSVLTHELEETVTDPQLNAWYSANGNENADKCAWTWGSTSQATTGAPFTNIVVGGKSYLIQQNFKLSGTSPSKSTSTTHTWPGSCATR
jgi:Phosphate-induced protein 1 conserved region